MGRRIEIIAFEHERIIQRPVVTECPVCLSSTEFLTPGQAAALVQVGTDEVYEWVGDGVAHGATTPNGEQLICRNSLLRFKEA